MHFTLVAIGSRGDVQPLIALGAGLRRAGHHARLATHLEFKPLIEAQGLEFAELHGDMRAMLGNEDGHRLTSSGGNPLKFAREFRRLAHAMAADLLSSCLSACRGTDLIIVSGIGFYAGYPVAQKLGLPYLQTHLQPVTPTRDFTMPVMQPLKLGGLVNYASYVVGGQLFWQGMRGPLNTVQRELWGMPPLPFFGPFFQMARQRDPVVYGYSAHVVPVPQDWPDFAHVTGYWFLDQADHWQPPRELLEFIEAGSPPVSIGFGSMGNRDPEHTTALVLKALELSKQRGLLLTGWGGLAQAALPDHVFKIEAAPHDWLFPRMGAIIHHGGAGTTAAALRSGVPSIAIPFFADQPFWAERAHRIGASPQPIPRKHLTAERLAEAITRAVTDAGQRRQAAAIGAQIRSEDGVTRAVELINRLAVPGAE